MLGGIGRQVQEAQRNYSLEGSRGVGLGRDGGIAFYRTQR